MKKYLIIITLLVSSTMMLSCTKSKNTASTSSQLATSSDTITVNNQTCAMTGSPLRTEDMGKWTSTVEYNGQNRKHAGKKFVFNQCCAMCKKNFHKKWQNHQDDILKEHGVN
jgi:hypothetical protein